MSTVNSPATNGLLRPISLSVTFYIIRLRLFGLQLQSQVTRELQFIGLTVLFKLKDCSNKRHPYRQLRKLSIRKQVQVSRQCFNQSEILLVKDTDCHNHQID